jgi:hypothetical protein
MFSELFGQQQQQQQPKARRSFSLSQSHKSLLNDDDDYEKAQQPNIRPWQPGKRRTEDGGRLKRTTSSWTFTLLQ